MKRELLGGVLLIGLLSGSWYLATPSVVSAEEEGEENEENYESDSEKNEVGKREEGASSAQPVSLPLYQTECGSCHVAYSPGHLPETSWRTIMNNLDRHYGEDASIDATTAKTITDFLIAHSGAQSRGEGTVQDGRDEKGGLRLPRITETHWFKEEHNEIRPQVWKHEKIGSPANCAACHQKAEQGDYSEQNILMPR